MEPRSRVEGLGFRAEGLGSRVPGLGLEVKEFGSFGGLTRNPAASKPQPSYGSSERELKRPSTTPLLWISMLHVGGFQEGP